MRVFAYCRVSTADQKTDNQVLEIRASGHTVMPTRVVTETISGSVAAGLRPAFQKLLERLESGDVLIVTKLGRLGRSAVDVRNTVDKLAELGVQVKCLQLGALTLPVLLDA